MNEAQLRRALDARDDAIKALAARIEPLIAEVAALRHRAEAPRSTPVVRKTGRADSGMVDFVAKIRDAHAAADRLASAVEDLRAVAAARGIRT